MKQIQEDKMLISKIIDKINTSKIRNKVVNSDFLNDYQISLLQHELTNHNNYVFFGGYEESQMKIFISYPNGEEYDICDILKAIKIELPNEICGKITHRDYLGTVMSFGLERSRIGDIIVYEDMAYIVVLRENAEYIKNSFEFEKRFKKAKITVIDVKDIKVKKQEFEEITISVNSLRLDNVISEITKTSRKISQKLLNDEKVSINYCIEAKCTKQLKEKDVLIIRGYGKYIVESFIGKNKNDKEIIHIKKYK